MERDWAAPNTTNSPKPEVQHGSKLCSRSNPSSSRCPGPCGRGVWREAGLHQTRPTVCCAVYAGRTHCRPWRAFPGVDAPLSHRATAATAEGARRAPATAAGCPRPVPARRPAVLSEPLRAEARARVITESAPPTAAGPQAPVGRMGAGLTGASARLSVLHPAAPPPPPPPDTCGQGQSPWGGCHFLQSQSSVTFSHRSPR